LDEEADAELAPLDLDEARRRIENAIVILKLDGAEGRPLREVRGVVVDPDGVVLCRLSSLLGAHRATCRLAGSARAVPVLGSIHHDQTLDQALVRIGVEEEPLEYLPLLEATGVIEGGERLFVLSGERVKPAEVSEPRFFTGDGVAGLRLAAEPPVVAGSFLAVDVYGYLVGLCRPLEGGRLAVDEQRLEGKPYRVLVVPAAGLARFVGGRALVTIYELTGQLYVGTFADLEIRGRRAYAERRWAVALDLLGQALERALVEAVPDARFEQVTRELRESYLEEVRRLRNNNQVVEAVELAEVALARFPDDPALWLELVQARLSLGENREGIAALLELRQLEPGTRVDSLLEVAYLRLGAEALRANNARYAESVYLEGLGFVPDSAAMHIELAKIYRDWKAYDEAVRLLRRAKELDPTLTTEIDVYLEKIDDAVKRRDAVVIPFMPGSSSIRAKAVIDGRGELPFIIDTGATYTALPERAVRELGYDPNQGELMQVKTAGGPLAVRTIYLGSLSLEGYAVRNLKVIVLPDNVGPNVGLLGLNFLRFFKYEVDSRRREFRLERQ
jgi:clan AA aspartic protease (TIGR02281 family)